MYNPKESGNEKQVVKFRKTEVILELGCGYNPDKSRERGISSFMLTTPYIKYDNTWYFIQKSWKWCRLSDIKEYLKEDVYSEEQFLEKLIDLISK